MENHQRCGLFYNCDVKYIHGHKCNEHKLFHMDVTLPIHYEEIIMVDNT